MVGVLVSDVRVPGARGHGRATDVCRWWTPGPCQSWPDIRSGRAGWRSQELDPPESDQPAPLSVKDLPGADVGLSWRNAAYAVQWIVFAGFVVFFWSRFRRELVERPRDQETIR